MHSSSCGQSAWVKCNRSADGSGRSASLICSDLPPVEDAHSGVKETRTHLCVVSVEIAQNGRVRLKLGRIDPAEFGKNEQVVCVVNVGSLVVDNPERLIAVFERLQPTSEEPVDTNSP